MGLKAVGLTDLPSQTVDWMDVVRSCKSLVPFDTANLMFAVAWCYASNCYHGDYHGAIVTLKKYFQYYSREKLLLLYVLDGKTDNYKAPENLRRSKGRALAAKLIEDAISDGGRADLEVYRRCVKITARYIALVAKLLQFMNLPFLVANKEADGQLCALALDGVAVSFDSDLLAHGVLDKIRVTAGGWHSGRATKTSVRGLLCLFPLSGTGMGACNVYCKHGKLGLVYFGALTGSDYSPLSCGIPGIGHKRACYLLMSLDAPLSIKKVANAVFTDYFASLGLPFQRNINENGIEYIIQHIEPVVSAFLGATYYDKDCNICLVSQPDIVVEPSSPELVQHSRGLLDPSTGELFVAEDLVCLRNFDMFRIGKKAVHLDPQFVNSCNIPDEFQSLKVDQLRAIVAARGGTVTHVKEELLAYVKAMKEIEVDYQPIVINTTSGYYLNTLSTKGSLNPRKEVDKLLEQKEIITVPKFKSILETVQRMYLKNKVIEDMDEIGMNAAVMSTKFINFLYADVGQTSQCSHGRKVIKDAYSKSKEQICNKYAGRRYHGYAVISPTQHLLITTQSASLGKDESTRNEQKKNGQKPDPKMYLNIMELGVVPTDTNDECGHTFGFVNSILSSWCGCRAGQKECIHNGMSCLDQIRVWAPNYTGDDVCTQGNNSWQHRGATTLKSYHVNHPVHCHGFEKIVDNRTNYKYRSVRESRKLSDPLHYSVLSPADSKLLYDTVDSTTLFPVYNLLKRKRKDNRPCRAALTYQEGEIEKGLEDVRSNVELWGTITEVKQYQSSKLNNT